MTDQNYMATNPLMMTDQPSLQTRRFHSDFDKYSLDMSQLPDMKSSNPGELSAVNPMDAGFLHGAPLLGNQDTMSAFWQATNPNGMAVPGLPTAPMTAPMGFGQSYLASAGWPAPLAPFQITSQGSTPTKVKSEEQSIAQSNQSWLAPVKVEPITDMAQFQWKDMLNPESKPEQDILATIGQKRGLENSHHSLMPATKRSRSDPSLLITGQFPGQWANDISLLQSGGLSMGLPPPPSMPVFGDQSYAPLASYQAQMWPYAMEPMRPRRKRKSRGGRTRKSSRGGTQQARLVPKIAKPMKDNDAKWAGLTKSEREKCRRAELKDCYVRLTSVLGMRPKRSGSQLPDRADIVRSACDEIRKLEKQLETLNRRKAAAAAAAAAAQSAEVPPVPPEVAVQS